MFELLTIHNIGKYIIQSLTCSKIYKNVEEEDSIAYTIKHNPLYT